MTSNALPERLPTRVAVFAKAPVAGEVKTRLAPLLGPEAAASLHARLVRHALSIAKRSQVGPVELWCAPDERQAFFVRCATEFGATLHRQEGTDLGARMKRAFDAAFAEGGALIVIGSDCPALGPRDLQAAREVLQSCPVVIQPAEDGGYVLLGLSRPVPALFRDIAWGTDAVTRQTRARLEQAGIDWVELETTWDVDRPEDYARLRDAGLFLEPLQ